MWGLVLTASSVVAQFRRGFTTTSAITYPFPPRTAVIGIIGAMLGANKKTREGIELLRKLDEKLLVGVKWVGGKLAVFGLNNLYGKEEGSKNIKRVFSGLALWAYDNGRGKIARLPTPTEFVLYPRYEVALLSEDETLLKQIEDRVVQRKFVYAPYLGVQGALASIELKLSLKKASKIEEKIKTYYTVPSTAAEVVPDGKIYTAKFPRRRDYGDPLRRVEEYTDVFWVSPGGVLEVKPKGGVWEIDGEAIPVY